MEVVATGAAATGAAFCHNPSVIASIVAKQRTINLCNIGRLLACKLLWFKLCCMVSPRLDFCV
jgi:hypothetical protein